MSTGREFIGQFCGVSQWAGPGERGMGTAEFN